MPARQPDVIIASSMKRGGDYEAVRKGWMKWKMLPAVRNNKVCIIDSDLTDLPSPRVVEGLEMMASWIHPERFFEIRHIIFPQYFTSIRNKPWGGAFIPAFVLSFASRISGISSGALFPMPTSTRAPAIVLTIYRRKPLASI